MSDDKLIYPVHPIVQSKKWDCGPTALRIVLQYQFGLKLTAKDTLQLTGVTMNGADEYNLTNALTVLGFKYKMGLHGTFVKLKSILEEGQTPIVHLVMHDGIGHYMVFTGYDEQNVYLADPAKGKIIKYGIPFFMGVWKAEEKETQTRWYLAVTGYSGDKIDGTIKRYKRIQKKLRASRN